MPSSTPRPSSGKSRLSQTSSAVLRPLGDSELAPPASRLNGRPLRPVSFKPERGGEPQSDGAGLTKVGARFREVLAEIHGIGEDEIDLGLVRLVEALNADTDHNHAALSALQIKRTEFGMLYQVRFVANTPLLLPWLTNGRSLRRLGSALDGSTKLLTSAIDHDRYGLPVMEVGGPEDVLGIVNAQRRLVKLADYTSAAEKRDRIDSIVQFGVLEAPDIMLTQLVSPEGSSWVAEAAEGAQRLFSSLIGLDALALRSVHSLATAHWFDASPGLRDFFAEDLRDLEESLRFKSSAAATYFPGADEEAWVENFAARTPAAVAFQLMRTMTVNLTLLVEPDPVTTALERHPVAATIQELIRSYHVPGKMKDAWQDADVNGLVAIGVIDELRAQGRLSEAERSSWLGEQALPWSGPNLDPNGEVGNRLLSATRLMAAMTAEDAVDVSKDGTEPSLAVVNRLLRHNSKRPHPDQRANVAAAQTAATLGLSGEGTESTVVAALGATFRANWFWKTSEQGSESWSTLLTLPLHELAQRAQVEREKGLADPTLIAGPAQRAIAALGGVALIANPGLLADGEALTRTGRGGGGKNANVKASDPSVLLEHMVAHERGIHQLHDAIESLTLGSETSVPIDREEKVPLTDLYLRGLWLGSTRDPSQTPQTEFARRLQELSDQLKACLADSEDLRTATPNSILDIEPDEDEEYPEDPLYEAVGINEQMADDTLQLMLRLNDFFSTGKAYAKAAARSSR